MKNKTILLPIIISLMLTSGCASVSGKPFARIESIPKDKGVIYIYRPYEAAGSAVRHEIYEGSNKICVNGPGGYCTFLADPGTVVLTSLCKVFGGKCFDGGIGYRFEALVEVSGGRQYFVKNPINGPGMHLYVVPEIMGLKEIQECKLVN